MGPELDAGRLTEGEASWGSAGWCYFILSLRTYCVQGPAQSGANGLASLSSRTTAPSALPPLRRPASPAALPPLPSTTERVRTGTNARLPLKTQVWSGQGRIDARQNWSPS